MLEQTPTVFDATIGGLAIGLAIAVNAVLLGRTTCFSSILGGLVTFDESWFWRVAFHSGMAIGTFMLKNNFPHLFVFSTNQVAAWKLAIAGFLLGFGTRLGDGGLSGHAICGLSRLSYRSIVCLTIFSSVAIAVYWFTGGCCAQGLASAVSMQDMLILQVEPLKLFFTCIKPVFIGLVGVIFVSVKGMTRTVSSLNWFLPLLVGAYAGYLFSMGIGFSGMILPTKWFGLWDITFHYSWDPSLLFVLFPALLLSYTSFYLLKTENNRPILYSRHYIPDASGGEQVDWLRVVIGAVLFGLGLGWVGMTPETLSLQMLGNPHNAGIRVTFIGMVVGMGVFALLNFIAPGMESCREKKALSTKTRSKGKNRNKE